MPSDTRRDARSARDSDATGTTTPRGHDKEKTKSKGMNGTLDGWVEPSLAAKPSFEDHGGAPYGVLEHMQPLGEPPSTRVRARVKGDGARKSLLGKGGAGAGLDAQETPEGTPGPQSSQTALEALPPLPLVPMDDSDDDDYAPGKKSKKKEKVAKPRGGKRQSEAAGSSAEAPPPSGKGKGRGKKIVEKTPKAADKPAPPPPTAPERININRIYYPEKLKAVVDEARRRAIESGKKSLAEAVEEIHTQSLTNQHLTRLLEAILCQNATPEQTAEFQVYVKQAKKKLRLAKAEAAGKSSAAEVNGTKPLPVRSPVKEETIPQVKQELPANPVTEKAALPKPKFSIKVKSPPKQSSSNRTPQSSSPVKHKTEDMDNDSDLSELTELSEGEEMAVDTPEERDEMSAGPPQLSNGTKAKDQAAERGSLGVQGSNLKRSSADAEIQETEDDRVLSAKKLKLSGKVTREYDYTDSHIRSSLSGLPRGARGPGAKNGAASTPRITLQPNGGGNASARSSRAISIDAESPLSSPAGSSRRSTPGHVWKGPPKQTGKRAKTKTSPEKKQHHPAYAGMPGAGGAGRDSPIGEDDNEELSENNDFCSSCGGAGFLLCCDGCDRAFHFTCLDPPIKDEASELNEPWFCFICVAKRPASIEQPEKPARGILAPLLNSLNKKNPETFALPQYIRDYFEGVATAKNGEFTEAVKPKTRRGGYDDRPDDYKLKDSKGNSVLCYACHKSSLGKRAIITCDYCSQHWHTDCLDPPLANPPCRDPNGIKTSDWMCPLHVDHELRQVDTRLLKPAQLSRRVHIRKPRQSKTMETALQRGLQNNGIIEIADDDSDEADSEFYEDDREPTTVFKMPAQGIKLDFIDKVKQTRIQDYHQAQRLHKRIKLDHATNAPGVLSQPNFTRRSIRDQQTAISLAQFANANPDLDLGGDRVENLVGALIAEAPEQVIDDIAAGEGQTTTHTNGTKAPPIPTDSQQHTKSSSLSPEQRKELEMLQELIKRKLQGS